MKDDRYFLPQMSRHWSKHFRYNTELKYRYFWCGVVDHAYNTLFRTSIVINYRIWWTYSQQDANDLTPVSYKYHYIILSSISLLSQ